MSKPNLNLLNAIRGAGLRQVDLAKITGQTPATISQMVNGWLIPNEEKKQRIAAALDKRVDEIFN